MNSYLFIFAAIVVSTIIVVYFFRREKFNLLFPDKSSEEIKSYRYGIGHPTYIDDSSNTVPADKVVEEKKSFESEEFEAIMPTLCDSKGYCHHV